MLTSELENGSSFVFVVVVFFFSFLSAPTLQCSLFRVKVPCLLGG